MLLKKEIFRDNEEFPVAVLVYRDMKGKLQGSYITVETTLDERSKVESGYHKNESINGKKITFNDLGELRISYNINGSGLYKYDRYGYGYTLNSKTHGPYFKNNKLYRFFFTGVLDVIRNTR